MFVHRGHDRLKLQILYFLLNSTTIFLKRFSVFNLKTKTTNQVILPLKYLLWLKYILLCLFLIYRAFLMLKKLCLTFLLCLTFTCCLLFRFNFHIWSRFNSEPWLNSNSMLKKDTYTLPTHHAEVRYAAPQYQYGSLVPFTVPLGSAAFILST